jgi:hypothetical protein
MINREGAAQGGGGGVASFGVVLPAFGPLASRGAFNDAVDTIEGLGFDDGVRACWRSAGHPGCMPAPMCWCCPIESVSPTR